jgi:hypothetical protein
MHTGFLPRGFGAADRQAVRSFASQTVLSLHLSLAEHHKLSIAVSHVAREAEGRQHAVAFATANAKLATVPKESHLLNYTLAAVNVFRSAGSGYLPSKEPNDFLNRILSGYIYTKTQRSPNCAQISVLLQMFSSIPPKVGRAELSARVRTATLTLSRDRTAHE